MRHPIIIGAGLAAMAAVISWSALTHSPMVLGIRGEFVLFGLTLVGVALLHHRTFEVAISGLASITLFRLLTGDFQLALHLRHEAPIVINLLGLLLGFAVLARHFEQSEVPELMPNLLPDGASGGFLLLVMVFVLSAFLDNIAAAMIGATVAMHVYKGHVDIGFLAAIVAASNAGGSGSVLGDTTTTMMWIDGVTWDDVLHAYVAAVPAFLAFAVVATWQQHRYHPIQRSARAGIQVRWRRLAAVALVLAGALVANVLLDFPAAGVWAAIFACAPFVATDWKVVRASLKGSLFLIALVVAASMMPVSELPPASPLSAFLLGLLSSVFDNIPLTKLALDQGGYDWGMLAYAVGFGGSMIWFGSSAGVAVSNLFPRARSVADWVTRGWHVAVAYVVGYAVAMAVIGWHPHAPHREDSAAAAVFLSAVK